MHCDSNRSSMLRAVVVGAGLGGSGGLLALAVDQAALRATLGEFLPVHLAAGAVYLVAGATWGLVCAAFGQAFHRPLKPGLALSASFALLYCIPVAERVVHLLGPWMAPTVAATCAVAGGGAYLVWVWALAKLSGVRARAFGAVIAGVTCAFGLAVNRHLVHSAVAPAALMADLGLVAAAAAVVLLARVCRPVVLIVVAGAGGVAAVALFLGDTPRQSARASDGQRPNVVLVVVDTLRHDVFNAVLAETPEGRTLRSSLHGAAWFSNAVAVAPWTGPSVASIMTGRYPSEHGFGPLIRSEGEVALPRIREDLPTLAERLGRSGYRAEALITNYMLQPQTGLDRGFDRYEVMLGAPHHLPLLAVARACSIVPSAPYQPAPAVRRAADRLFRRLARGSQPWFLWLHLMDPHDPLVAHPELPVENERAVGSLPEAERLYRDEVRVVAREVARIVGLLQSRGLWRNTLFVLVSDHGEMFPSDGHAARLRQGLPPARHGHGHSLYGELLRVPLVIRSPVSLASGSGDSSNDRVLPGLASHVDLIPTIVELVGLNREEDGDEVSFAAQVRGSASTSSARSYAFSGTVCTSAPRQRSVSDGRLKLIQYLDGEHGVELYDVERDPAEQDNVAPAMPGVVTDGLRLLDALRGKTEPAEPGHAVAMSADTQRQLRALGYLK